MIVGKIINAIENMELEIIDVTLLSIEEVEKLPKRLKEYKYWWWLRSPGADQYSAASVLPGGSVYYYGDYVYHDIGCVRPALIINFESSNFNIGDCFIFNNKEFEIVSKELAFCKSDIGYHRFDTASKNYETSEIKNYIDNWFKSNI